MLVDSIPLLSPFVQTVVARVEEDRKVRDDLSGRGRKGKGGGTLKNSRWSNKFASLFQVWFD